MTWAAIYGVATVVRGQAFLGLRPVRFADGDGLRHRLGRGPLAKIRDEGLFSLVHVPDNVALFLGGGGAATCGYRYAMDFVPFVFALVAIALTDRFGNLEKVSIGLSVAFVTRAPARRCSPAL